MEFIPWNPFHRISFPFPFVKVKVEAKVTNKQ